MTMTTTFRALVFGAIVAVATTVALDTVTAAEVSGPTPNAIRLDGVEVIAHRANFDADGDPVVTRLEPVVVIGHRAE